MNLKQLLAGLEAAVPAVGQVVTAMHPENTAEGIKIAAGVQLFQFVCAGLHQIAAASESPAQPASVSIAQISVTDNGAATTSAAIAAAPSSAAVTA